ncbi:hypothetical protein SY2F82_54930 [Streptomyces sp. Y2F8-2]|nr:hypothetical protein SY2F82_54930 [Streptomyces sp. Y2F8-2]
MKAKPGEWETPMGPGGGRYDSLGPDAAQCFALRAFRLVPWEPIGDTPLGCVIICTQHSRSRVSGCAGGVA